MSAKVPMDPSGRLMHFVQAYFPEALSRPLPSQRDETREFRAMARLLKASQRWSLDRMAAFQLKALRALVFHAQQNVPAHRQRWETPRVGVDTLRSLKDLEQFPLMTLDDLRENPEAFRAQNFTASELEVASAGGHPGHPSRFYQLKTTHDQVIAACREAALSRIGFSRGESVVLDLTTPFSPDVTRWDEKERSLHLSTTQLHSASSTEILDALECHPPEFVIGEPSSAVLLAKLLLDAGRTLSVKSVILSSAMLQAEQLALVEKIYGARIFSWYGMAEYAGFAAACEHSAALHFFPEIGIVELVGPDGRVVENEGEEGEIVLTGFHTWATPFIRYRTGDRGVMGANPCPSCNRPYPTIERLHQRADDFLLNAQGERVPATAIHLHHDVLRDVWECQVVQDAPGLIAIRVLAKPTFDESTAARICDSFRARLGTQFACHVEKIATAASRPAGRRPYLVQRAEGARAA